ncbi:hypothetical protein KCP70_05610 [Salmonella enterica subsp. enterica]|nr:hypothetical protein KCP70_05610 [Salmonella enterica subsp. enterica]
MLGEAETQRFTRYRAKDFKRTLRWNKWMEMSYTRALRGDGFREVATRCVYCDEIYRI